MNVCDACDVSVCLSTDRSPTKHMNPAQSEKTINDYNRPGCSLDVHMTCSLLAVLIKINPLPSPQLKLHFYN